MNNIATEWITTLDFAQNIQELSCESVIFADVFKSVRDGHAVKNHLPH